MYVQPTTRWRAMMSQCLKLGQTQSSICYRYIDIRRYIHKSTFICRWHSSICVSCPGVWISGRGRLIVWELSRQSLLHFLSLWLSPSFKSLLCLNTEESPRAKNKLQSGRLCVSHAFRIQGKLILLWPAPLKITEKAQSAEEATALSWEVLWGCHRCHRT